MGKYEKIFRGRPVEDFDFEEILYEKKDWVATITLNRPKQYNAYTGTELFEICEALHDVTVDDKIAVAVITGAGDKAFCTGGDAGTYATIYPKRPHEFYAWWEYYERMLYMIRTCGKPVIARINASWPGAETKSTWPVIYPLPPTTRASFNPAPAPAACRREAQPSGSRWPSATSVPDGW